METKSTITSQDVLDHYSALAREDSTSNADHTKKVAQLFGYTPEDLAGIPEGANLGVSCGNPLMVASLKPGETVIDLGCGAGFDVFQAARKIGPTGLSIGIDMSQDMLARANRNAEKSSITNVKFVLSPITKILLENESADCVISNCVINLLTPDEKPLCFAEVYRLLKPGGRLAVSDILAKKPLPEELQRNLGLYVGCISGASLVDEYENWLKSVGFEDIMIVDKKMDLNIYKDRSQNSGSSCYAPPSGEVEAAAAASSCCAPPPASSCCSTSTSNKKEAITALQNSRSVENVDFNEWVSSYSIYAVKPRKA